MVTIAPFWCTRASAFGKGEVAARIFTGSGSPGVPLGLLVGETSLPTGAGTHLLRVRQGVDFDAQHEVSVRVRRTEKEESGS